MSTAVACGHSEFEASLRIHHSTWCFASCALSVELVFGSLAVVEASYLGARVACWLLGRRA